MKPQTSLSYVWVEMNLLRAAPRGYLIEILTEHRATAYWYRFSDTGYRLVTRLKTLHPCKVNTEGGKQESRFVLDLSNIHLLNYPVLGIIEFSGYEVPSIESPFDKNFRYWMEFEVEDR